jgi:hypothetical protein
LGSHDDGLDRAGLVPRSASAEALRLRRAWRPTIWVDGRIVGGWAQRRSGEVVPNLLEDPGAEARGEIDAAASALETWLGDARVTPSFPSLD